MESLDKLNTAQRPIASLLRFAVHFVDPDAEVILYGSQARGEANKHSDWDLVVIRNEKMTQEYWHKVFDAIYLVELGTGEIISPTVVDREQWESHSGYPFNQNVMKDGISLNSPELASL